MFKCPSILNILFTCLFEATFFFSKQTSSWIIIIIMIIIIMIIIIIIMNHHHHHHHRHRHRHRHHHHHHHQHHHHHHHHHHHEKNISGQSNNTYFEWLISPQKCHKNARINPFWVGNHHHHSGITSQGYCPGLMASWRRGLLRQTPVPDLGLRGL